MKIIVCDIETDSLDQNKGGIVEICFVLFNLLTGEAKIIIDERIKPYWKLDKEAWVFNNTSLTVEEVEKGKDIIPILKELVKWASNYPITGYNFQFDRKFIYHIAIKKKIQLKMKCFKHEIMYILQDYLKIPHDYYKYKRPSFQEAYRLIFNEPEYIEKHRAKQDVLDECRLIQHVLVNKLLPEVFVSFGGKKK